MTGDKGMSGALPRDYPAGRAPDLRKEGRGYNSTPRRGWETSLRLLAGLRVSARVLAKGFAMPERQDKYGNYALVLLLVGALVRLLLMAWLRPLSSFNPYLAPSYIVAAQDTLLWNFHALGDRVPVYPLLIALCGLNPREIWVVQSILGVAASLMIFDMAFRRTRHGLCSLLIGLSCSLVPEVLI